MWPLYSSLIGLNFWSGIPLRQNSFIRLGPGENLGQEPNIFALGNYNNFLEREYFFVCCKNVEAILIYRILIGLGFSRNREKALEKEIMLFKRDYFDPIHLKRR